MNKKAIAALALSAVMSITALTACGGNPSSDGGNRTTIEEPWWTTVGTLEKENGAVVFEDVEISLTTVVNGADLAPFNQLIAQFNRAYDGKIHVDVTSLTQTAFEETVSQQIKQNNNPPDLIMSHQKGHKGFVENNLIQPFDEVMEQSGIQISMTDYSAGLSAHSSLGYEGYTFGVPIDAQSEVVYYNKQMLAKYGGDLPTTREELITLCDTVARGENITPISWSTSLSFFADYIFPTAIIQNGGHFYDSFTYRLDWYDDAQNLQAFKDGIASIRELTTHAPALAQYNVSQSAALNNFLSNNALFYVAMPWDAENILAAYGAQNGNLTVDSVKRDRVGGTSLTNWFALDGSTDGDKIFGDSHFFAMSNSVRDINKKAAICEFVKWFTQTSSVGTAWAEAGHISASTAILNSTEYNGNDFVRDYVSQFYPDINSFECAGVTPYYSDTFNELSALLVTTSRNTTAAQDEQSIKAAQDKINGIIDFINM